MRTSLKSVDDDCRALCQRQRALATVVHGENEVFFSQSKTIEMNATIPVLLFAVARSLIRLFDLAF